MGTLVIRVKRVIGFKKRKKRNADYHDYHDLS